MNIQDARVTLSTIQECQIKAGIEQHCFLSFGTLLGALRPTARKVEGKTIYIHGVMEHDDDLDIGVFYDQITKEQQEAYIAYLREKNMFWHREKYQHRTDTNMIVWFSLRKKIAPVGTKCCHWFWIKWKDYYWHTKGADWANLDKNKFPLKKYPRDEKSVAMMLGVPAEYFSELIPIEYEGMTWKVPLRSGKCVDLWYPSWAVPRVGGASAKKIIATVGKWEDQSTWRIISQ